MTTRTPRHRIRAPLSLQRWDRLTFIHWSFEPTAVERLLPGGLEPHLWDGRAWVGLTPFVMAGLRGPGLPAVPAWSTFPETNLRTYVRGPAGDGLWFFSLDVARLSVATALRTALGLPYVWARMAVTEDAGDVTYTSRRRSGFPAGTRITATPGAMLDEGQVTDLHDYLTARWGAYSYHAGSLLFTPVAHPPWPLADATLVDLREDLVAAAGLPAPDEEPLVHFSPGVDVRIGVPRPVR